jgi:hypothetical protein
MAAAASPVGVVLKPSGPQRTVPVDPMKLLEWIAERERDFPGAPLNGETLMRETSGLAGDDSVPWEAVAKAAARLRKRGHLDWDYTLWPNESHEPRPEDIDYQNFQRTREITVSGTGLQALAAAQTKTPSHQVNVAIGQLALGDITNFDVLVIVDAAEQALDQLDAPADVKAEARTMLQRMRSAGKEVASSAAAELVAAAFLKVFGLA